MGPRERHTYFGYREGLDPSVMTLGSLVFDYANPRTKRPYIHEGLSPVDVAGSCLVDERSGCYVAYQGDSGFSFGFGLNDLVAFDTARSGTSYNVVAGEIGSRIELREPDVFFIDQVLANQKARLWLQSRLSVARWLKLRKGLTERSPRIWFLTGLYLIEDATCFNVGGSASSLGGKLAVPIPEPSGIAALLKLNVGAWAKISSTNVVVASSKTHGKRVWAAQFQQVRARYVREDAWDESSLRILRLVDVFSLETQRFANNKRDAAEVALMDDTTTQGDQTGDEATVEIEDDEYWQAFEQGVDAIVDE